MATARCYTKSGSVEKYESGCFSGGINHYPNPFNSNITGPDSNGNYSITYNGYDDGDSSNYDCYCETIYGDWRNGGGVKKTFYFKESIKEIYLQSGIATREGYLLIIYLAFGNNEYLGNDKLTVNVQITSNGIPIGIPDFDNVTFTIDKNSTPSLTKIFSLNPEYKNLRAKTISCSPMGGRNYRVTIRN